MERYNWPKRGIKRKFEDRSKSSENERILLLKEFTLQIIPKDIINYICKILFLLKYSVTVYIWLIPINDPFNERLRKEYGLDKTRYKLHDVPEFSSYVGKQISFGRRIELCKTIKDFNRDLNKFI